MKAIVVYESMWGNTAEIAKAIAFGIGSDATAMSTDEATAAEIAGADMIVAGAPLLGFSLPTEKMLADIKRNPASPPPVNEASNKSMRMWLKELPKGAGKAASFETRIWWSPGSSSKAILKQLEAAGYSPASPAEKFLVTGQYGPLKEGELERAREWGAKLAS